MNITSLRLEGLKEVSRDFNQTFRADWSLFVIPVLLTIGIEPITRKGADFKSAVFTISPSELMRMNSSKISGDPSRSSWFLWTLRITGIEPISPAWKADNLPLIYIRIFVSHEFFDQNRKQRRHFYQIKWWIHWFWIHL